MKASNRKTRSDKFPLILHPTGQYCKKIRGKIYYFGSDRRQALQNYLDQATFLHGYNSSLQKSADGNMTLKQLCDMYLKYQHTKLQANIIPDCLSRLARTCLQAPTAANLYADISFEDMQNSVTGLYE